MTPKQKLDALASLQKSKGWQLLVQLIDEEMVKAASNMGRSANMETQEVDFRRGMICAAQNLKALPQTLITQLENDMLFESKDDSSKS